MLVDSKFALVLPSIVLGPPSASWQVKQGLWVHTWWIMTHTHTFFVGYGGFIVVNNG